MSERTITTRPKRRWGDNDRHFGPFTLGKNGNWRPLMALLSSGDEEDTCHVRLSAFGWTLICELPQIVKHSRRWVDTSRYEWSKSPEGGYWDVHANEYGFTLSNGHLDVALGPQTHDSSTERRWGCFLPWTQWRHVRHSVYGQTGLRYADVPDMRLGDGWEARQAIMDECPSMVFVFRDFDGETLSATTRIEEREWRFGTGWFKWLSLFRRPKVRRYLEIKFSGETGKGKGSWKGGTIGHSIDMLPGELHEAAFRRYCAEHDMTFDAQVPA